MVALNFNASQVAPAGSYPVYDTGEYTVMITGSELKPTKAKAAGTAQKGSYFEMKYRIVEGPNNGGSITDRVNWENDNSTAEEVGRGQLSAICRVVGVMHLQDTQQLHGIPFKIMLVKKPRSDDATKWTNEISEYRNMQGVAADMIGQVAGGSAGAAPAQPAQPAQPAAPAQPPAPAPAQPAPPPAAAPAPAHDPVKAAEADGWVLHPQNPAYHYKGQEVVATTDLVGRYPAPQPAAPAPAAAAPWQQEQPPATPAPAPAPATAAPVQQTTTAQQPAGPSAPPAGSPPWAQGAPAAAPAGAPPWAQG